jgi:hypothetical protein
MTIYGSDRETVLYRDPQTGKTRKIAEWIVEGQDSYTYTAYNADGTTETRRHTGPGEGERQQKRIAKAKAEAEKTDDQKTQEYHNQQKRRLEEAAKHLGNIHPKTEKQYLRNLARTVKTWATSYPESEVLTNTARRLEALANA